MWQELPAHVTEIWPLSSVGSTAIIPGNISLFAGKTHYKTNTTILITSLSDQKYLCHCFWFNSLPPNDAIWQYESGLALVQVMACCLLVPHHYLMQCWFLISREKSKFVRRVQSTCIMDHSVTVKVTSPWTAAVKTHIGPVNFLLYHV